MDTIEFRRTKDDLFAFSVFLSERMGQMRRYKIWGVVFAVLFFGGAALWRYRQTEAPAAALSYVVVGALYAIAWVLWLGPWRQRQCLRKAVKRLYGEAPDTSHKVTLTDEGIEETSSEGNTFHSWSGVPEIARTDDHLFLFVGPGAAHILPVSAFPSKREAEVFFSTAKERKARSNGSPAK